ncbi:rod-binding protein [Sagittula salina]|uniref:Rod-binding protein n=1 Tax=Sagittula salina TaxID=2820268 RepID=A0A940MK94_9RHOB|nr:rod-binding protein [Sagittula salina]MBP0483355.1 rod-binding protein [Sagittula salina]
MELPSISPDAASPRGRLSAEQQEKKLRAAAMELEANFLAEMLKAAGVGKPPETFGGGAGEDQFASLMRLEQARELSASGGIGLAESIYHALKEKIDG